jgi:hypothetical protein
MESLCANFVLPCKNGKIRKTRDRHTSRTKAEPKHCFRCQRPGHLIGQCRARLPTRRAGKTHDRHVRFADKQYKQVTVSKTRINCFRCGREGHIAQMCDQVPQRNFEGKGEEKPKSTNWTRLVWTPSPAGTKSAVFVCRQCTVRSQQT